jgi:methylated-DNA-[protein]-cysteine S-methyltransferase
MTLSLHPVETAYGYVALCMDGGRLARVLLPRRSLAALGNAAPVAFRGLKPAPPGPRLRRVARALVGYFAGEDVDPAAAGVRLLDGTAPPVFRAAWRALRRVRRGEVVTYGELAARAGFPVARRAVGQAVSRNPFPLIVPCHRVISAASREGHLVAPGGIAIKRRLLRLEGHRKVVIGPASPKRQSTIGL